MSKILVVTPVYNAEKYIQKCIDSVKMQSFDNYIHFIIDDCSTDSTLKKIAESSLLSNNIVFSRHVLGKKGTLYNHIKAVSHPDINDNDIIVHLDGDDWFTDENVLQDIWDTYERTNCLATYGNYVCSDPNVPSVCKSIEDSCGDFRQQILHGWCFSQVRTFRKFLWDRIDKEDFKDSQGNLFSCAADVAIFVPILEMAGKDRVEFIERPLMVYNIENPIGDSKINLQDQARCAIEVARKPRYERYGQ